MATLDIGKSSFATYALPARCSDGGRALTNLLNTRQLTIEAVVGSAGIPAKARSERWLERGVPAVYAESVAGVLQCSAAMIASERHGAAARFAQCQEGIAFARAFMAATDLAPTMLTDEQSGIDCRELPLWYLFGVPTESAAAVAACLAVEPYSITQTADGVISISDSDVGLAMLCAMRGANCDATKIAEITGVKESVAKGWLKTGIPKKHCLLVAGFLGVHPLFLSRTLGPEDLLVTVGGMTFSRFLAENNILPSVCAAKMRQPIGMIHTWCRRGVPANRLRGAAAALGCRVDDISNSVACDQMPEPATEQAIKLQAIIKKSGLTLQKLAKQIGVNKTRLGGWLVAGVPGMKSLDVAIVLGCEASDIQKSRESSNITPQGAAFSDACARKGIGSENAQLKLGVRGAAFLAWRIKGVPKNRAIFIANLLTCEPGAITEKRE